MTETGIDKKNLNRSRALIGELINDATASRKRYFLLRTIAVCVLVLAIAAFLYSNGSVLAAICIASASLLMFGIGWRSAKEESARFSQKLGSYLKEDASEVVWIYRKQIDEFPFGIHFRRSDLLVIANSTGERSEFPMTTEQLELLRREVRKLNPTITLGYSRSKEQLFFVSPDLLVNEK